MTHPISMNLQIVQTSRLDKFRHPHNGVMGSELGLNEASKGMFSARRVKASGVWSLAEIATDPQAWLTIMYVLGGFITLRVHGNATTLRQHDAVCQAPIVPASVVEISPDFEFIEILARDDRRVLNLIPDKPAQLVSFDAPALHVKGQGPREFFDYRDLGIAEITRRQVEVQVIRAQRARKGGTGWHSHSMAQLSYGLSGWASLGVAGSNEPFIQKPGDAFCIPPGCVHNADSFSDDYWALQLQIPADYATLPESDPRVTTH